MWIYLLAHHWIYKTSGILHRDISISNIMFRREGKRSVSVSGVLCDWDLARDSENARSPDTTGLHAMQDSDGEEDVVIEIARYRTGTGPFMALDLLQERTVPPHLYRHDLESFFFVLVWFCAVYNPREQTFGHIKNWENSDLVRVGNEKRSFLQNLTTEDQVFGNASPVYTPLISAWIKPLRNLLRDVHASYSELGMAISYRDEALREGMLGEAERYRKEVAVIQRHRDDSLTYENFMQCLGEDVTGE